MKTVEIGVALGARPFDLKLADSAFQRSNGNQVAIVHVAYIVGTQRDESLSSTRGRDELNLEMIRIVDFDNRAQIPDAKTCFWHITLEHNRIEKLVHKSPRKGGDKSG